MRKEFGGFLPFDLHCDRKELFEEYEECTVRVNSGRSAICYAISQLQPQRIWLPYYNCPALKTSVECLNIEVLYYRLSKDLLPIINDFRDNDVLIWTNYFGISAHKNVEKILNSYRSVIFDNAQAFFEMPIIKPGIYNAYSCRKFLGVPDGGYIIGKDIEKRELQIDISWSKMNFLFKQIELNVNSAYKEYLSNEALFDNTCLGMSKLTGYLMKTFNYKYIAEVRSKNYKLLLGSLKNYNYVEIDDKNKGIPFVYPFLNYNNKLKEYLLSQHVYVPTWWKHVKDLNLGLTTLEEQYTDNLIPLPIDQRYNEEDMEELVKLIKDFL